MHPIPESIETIYCGNLLFFGSSIFYAHHLSLYLFIRLFPGMGCSADLTEASETVPPPLFLLSVRSSNRYSFAILNITQIPLLLYHETNSTDYSLTVNFPSNFSKASKYFSIIFSPISTAVSSS